MLVSPPAPRFRTEVLASGVRIVSPAQRVWFVLVFYHAWLVFWAIALIRQGAETLSNANRTSFEVLWLCFWSIGGLFSVLVLLWFWFGREEMSIENELLTHVIRVGPLKRSRAYAVGEIRNLRVLPVDPNVSTRRLAAPPFIAQRFNDAIAFEYGARTFGMGCTMDEGEAYRAVEALRATGRVHTKTHGLRGSTLDSTQTGNAKT